MTQAELFCGFLNGLLLKQDRRLIKKIGIYDSFYAVACSLQIDLGERPICTFQKHQSTVLTLIRF
jgi:hypothetical protein